MQFAWNGLKKPILILAPMEDVTDCAFREMFARYGKPDLLFTEFVSIDGLMSVEGRKKLSIDLKYTEIQRPIIGQIWGTNLDKFSQVAEYLVELGFDGIDINMGCPQTKEIAVGACAALIREPKKAQDIVRAVQKGAGSLPVSVKTRIGYSKIEEMEDWLKALLETNPAAITLHARTKKEMSKVPAHWDKLKEAVEIRNKENPNVILIGNGDIQSREDAFAKITEAGLDGAMVGRGAFGNPWFFNSYFDRNILDIHHTLSLRDGVQPTTKQSQGPGIASDAFAMTKIDGPTLHERFRVMLEHAELFDQMYAGVKPFQTMRKHFKAYCSGFHGAAELRAKLMEAPDLADTKAIVNEYLATLAPNKISV